MKSLRIAWILLLGGASIYGGIFSANKLVSEAGVPFIAYTFWQALIGGLMLLVVGIITNNLPKLTSEHIISYIITALLGIVIPILILTFIGNRLPASIIALAYTLIPGMTFIFAVILRLDKPRWLSIGGLVFGLIGVSVLLLPKGTLPANNSVLWVLLALVMPVLFATNNVYIAKVKPPKANALMLSTGLLLTAAVVTFPIMLASDGIYLFWQTSSSTTWIIIWTGCINMVSFFCMFEIIRRAGAIFFGQYNYVIVISGIVWSILIFNEILSFWFWIALASMLIGLYLSNAGTNQSIRELSKKSSQ